MDASSVNEVKYKYIKKTSMSTGIWGICLLLFSPILGGILILFSILIFTSRNMTIIKWLGGIILIFALIQLLYGVFLMNGTFVNPPLSEIDPFFNVDLSLGGVLLGISIINFGVGGRLIHRTRKLEETLEP